MKNKFTAALALADGQVFRGYGIGSFGMSTGEICFNTSMTGYQEILTDPSYSGQIINFTFPHIGNVGANTEDMETHTPVTRGLVLREDITKPSSWRATKHFNEWLKKNNLIGICGLDTRHITRLIRDNGAPVAAVAHSKEKINVEALVSEAQSWSGLSGLDLAKEVSCSQAYNWDECKWTRKKGIVRQKHAIHKIIAVDFGVKHNILRCLANSGCEITVVPAYSSAEEILSFSPDGIFLSNGPGDPAATGIYAVPMIKSLLERDIPIFGICLGHQLLSLALGAKTSKMKMGHRGANHPVKNLKTGKVEITSQNHGFVVNRESLPPEVTETYTSLFDNTVEGIALRDKPVFSVQYHPEASPGPQDSQHLFERFVSTLGKK
ncbi:MAG: carbamoyl phosphate synthase small subunit [Rhodospirillaceae bacterium]|nr:carbamoyl phosphate synthase small subunit [Rhodospirillaceae bacterium]